MFVVPQHVNPRAIIATAQVIRTLMGKDYYRTLFPGKLVFFPRSCTSNDFWLDGGAIAGVVIGCVVGVALCISIIGMIICCCKENSTPGMILPQAQVHPQFVYPMPAHDPAQPWPPTLISIPNPENPPKY